LRNSQLSPGIELDLNKKGGHLIVFTNDMENSRGTSGKNNLTTHEKQGYYANNRSEQHFGEV
jgi:hypothetical protein